MHTAILAAHAPEFDLSRVIFVIMVLLGGFFQWVMNWWKKKRAESEAMRQPPPTPEELQAREKAWELQTGAGVPAPLQPAARNPLEDLLKKFREIAAPEIVVAPVPVQLSPPPRAVAAVEVPKHVSTHAKVSSAPAAIVQQRPRHPLAVKLAAIGGLRQAVVLREILGPPKALQTADDHLI